MCIFSDFGWTSPPHKLVIETTWNYCFCIKLRACVIGFTNDKHTKYRFLYISYCKTSPTFWYRSLTKLLTWKKIKFYIYFQFTPYIFNSIVRIALWYTYLSLQQIADHAYNWSHRCCRLAQETMCGLYFIVKCICRTRRRPAMQMSHVVHISVW